MGLHVYPYPSYRLTRPQKRAYQVVYTSKKVQSPSALDQDLETKAIICKYFTLKKASLLQFPQRLVNVSVVLTDSKGSTH